MNWHEVRKTNAKRSARKARREAQQAERARKVEKAGGPITVGELRSASRRVEPPAPGCVQDRHVWHFRDQDWVIGWWNDDHYIMFCPFLAWRNDPEMKDAVPVTPGAGKWLAALLEAEERADDAEPVTADNDPGNVAGCCGVCGQRHGDAEPHVWN